MTILFIDTTLKGAAVAVGNGDAATGTILAHSINGHRHAATAAVADLTKEVLDHADLSLPDIETVVVSHGPGSFTGIKVGIAFAQGLRRGGDGPQVVGVSSLASLARFGNRDFWILPTGRFQGLVAFRPDVASSSFAILEKSGVSFTLTDVVTRRELSIQGLTSLSGQLVFEWDEFSDFAAAYLPNLLLEEFSVVALSALSYMGKMTEEILRSSHEIPAVHPLYLRGSAPEEKKLKGK